MSARDSVASLLSGHYEFHADQTDPARVRGIPEFQREGSAACAREIRRVYELAGYDLDQLPMRTLDRFKRDRGVAGDRCESGSECGRLGCPECQA